MIERPYLSIVVTVYNTEKYLEECLDSIVNQTFQDREIVLVNDGSTDNSESICRQYCERYNNTRLVNRPNGGASSARNTGIREAKGQYIHFVDSDDFLLENLMYETLLLEFSKSEPDIVFARCASCDPLTKETIKNQEPYSSPVFFQSDLVLQHVLEKQYPMTLTCPVNKIFKRDFLIENNLFFTVGIDHEEDEWLPRVISCAKNVYFTNRIIYGARDHRAGSLSAVPNEEIAARKARSKMQIAVSGMEYMEQKKLDQLTLRYVAGYYWEYMMAAVITTQRLKDRNLKKKNFAFIKANQRFFQNGKLLLNRNWRLMGWLFRHLGIRFTARLLTLRY